MQAAGTVPVTVKMRIGLVDDALLRTETSRGYEADFEGASSPGRAPIEATPSHVEIAPSPAPEADFLPLVAARGGEALLGGNGKVSSYPTEAAKEKSYRPRRYYLRGA